VNITEELIMLEHMELGTGTEVTTVNDPEKIAMGNIPTLFKRSAVDHRVMAILEPGCEWVLRGDGLMTIKVDGLNAKVKVGPDLKPTIWRRFKHQEEYIYIQCKEDNPSDEPFIEAMNNFKPRGMSDEGIYEVFGPKINGNPHDIDRHWMVKIAPADGCLLVSKHNHPEIKRGPTVSVEEFYESVQKELAASPTIEGLVFVLEDPPMHPVKWAKIKRKDFGLPWPVQVPKSLTSTAISLDVCDDCHRSSKCGATHVAFRSIRQCEVCMRTPANLYLQSCPQTKKPELKLVNAETTLVKTDLGNGTSLVTQRTLDLPVDHNSKLTLN
jgi:hypothetical protein